MRFIVFIMSKTTGHRPVACWQEGSGAKRFLTLRIPLMTSVLFEMLRISNMPKIAEQFLSI